MSTSEELRVTPEEYSEIAEKALLMPQGEFAEWAIKRFNLTPFTSYRVVVDYDAAPPAVKRGETE